MSEMMPKLIYFFLFVSQVTQFRNDECDEPVEVGRLGPSDYFGQIEEKCNLAKVIGGS